MSLCLILHGCLKNERKSAVVQLASDWFGLLNSSTEGSVDGMYVFLFANNFSQSSLIYKHCTFYGCSSCIICVIAEITAL